MLKLAPSTPACIAFVVFISFTPSNTPGHEGRGDSSSSGLQGNLLYTSTRTNAANDPLVDGRTRSTHTHYREQGLPQAQRSWDLGSAGQREVSRVGPIWSPLVESSRTDGCRYKAFITSLKALTLQKPLGTTDSWADKKVPENIRAQEKRIPIQFTRKGFRGGEMRAPGRGSVCRLRRVRALARTSRRRESSRALAPEGLSHSN